MSEIKKDLSVSYSESHPSEEMPAEDLDSLFEMLPEGTRIIIRGKTVTFENMTPELLDVALSLNPQDPDLQARRNKD